MKGGVRLYELSAYGGVAAQRLRWAPRVTPVANVLEAVDMLRFAPERVGLPDGATIEISDNAVAPKPGKGRVRLLEDEPGYAACDVDGDGGFVVFGEAHDPGWRATVDGVPAPVLRANAVLQAVQVPPGKHRVTFRYWPVHLNAGIGVSIVGLVVAGCVAAWSRRNHSLAGDVQQRTSADATGKLT